jgi:hypothetical protein
VSRNKFWTAVTSLLVVGGFLALVEVPLPGSELFKSIGHAFVVAGLLASTVDLYFKNVFFREGANDISKFLLGYELPDEIRNRIRTLMSTQLVRRDYHIKLKFPADVSLNQFPVEVEQSFDFDNITESSIWHTHTHIFDHSDTISELEISARCHPDLNLCYKGGDVPNETNSGKMIVSWLPAQIPAHNYSHGRHYQYGLKFTMKEKRIHDGHNFNFHVPTINLTIDIECPEAINAVVLVPDPDEESRSNHWEYKRLFTAGESIRVQWESAESKPGDDQGNPQSGLPAETVRMRSA